jgi:hypothetical protein
MPAAMMPWAVNWFPSAEWWMVGFTGALTVLAYLQAKWMRKNVEIAKQAADAAKASAEAAETTVTTMHDTAERQLRAYIGVHTATITQLPNKTSIHVHIEIKNTGQTPGYNVRIWHKIGVFDPPPHIPSFTGSENAESYPMLGVGGCLDLKNTAEHLDQAAMAQVLNGTRPTYAWGKVRYRDAFRIERVYEFRLIAQSKGGDGLFFSPALDGNKAD